MDTNTKNVKCTAPDGQSYKGEWRDDKPNGSGIMDFANQDQYEGDWKDGLMDG